MISRLARFNTYLLTVTLVAALAGCQSASEKREKQIARLRLHLEAGRDTGDRSESVPISRTAQVLINVDKAPFLDDGQLAAARLVDVPGGFKIAIQFDERGTWMLEQFSSTNPGKHVAIAAQFGEKLKETRWLAAPQLTRRISNGALTFTPDASREEAEEIVRGLNNVAIENGNQPKPEKGKAKDQ